MDTGIKVDSFLSVVRSTRFGSMVVLAEVSPSASTVSWSSLGLSFTISSLSRQSKFTSFTSRAGSFVAFKSSN